MIPSPTIFATLSSVSHYDSDLENQVMLYNKTIVSVLDSHCPVTARNHRFKSHPAWYTNEIYLARHTRHKLGGKWTKSRNLADHRLYLDEIHAFTRLTRKAKSQQLSTADTKNVFQDSEHSQQKHSCPSKRQLRQESL